MNDPVIVRWGGRVCYDLVDFSKDMISKRSYNKLVSLKEAIAGNIITMVPIPTTQVHNYWHLLLDGKIEGLGITTEDYLAKHYPEYLL